MSAIKTDRSTADTGRGAVLFDMDGTLVDSNYLHVHAWQRAFHELEVRVETWRIHGCIGMDGTTLVRELSGAADEDTRSRIGELHSAYYRETAPLLTPLPGARQLLRRVDEIGLQVVLATSAPEDELTLLRRVLDCDGVISEVTSSRDVDTAKPEPDIIQIALDHAGVTANRAVFVGDSVWDVEACNRAAVPVIGLLTGGVGRHELQTAGAIAVFESPAELLDQLNAGRVAAVSSLVGDGTGGSA